MRETEKLEVKRLSDLIDMFSATDTATHMEGKVCRVMCVNGNCCPDNCIVSPPIDLDRVQS